jgi:leucyl aminopeptidase
MAITFTAMKDAPDNVDAFIVAIFQGPDGPLVSPNAPGAEYLDAAHLKTSGVTGKPGMTHSVPGANGTTIIGVGVGKQEEATVDGVRSAFAVGARAARRFARVAAFIGASGAPGLDAKAVGQAIAEGVLLGTYKFTRLKKAGEVDALSEFIVLTTSKAAVQKGLDRGVVIAQYQCNARDWINEPAGELTPTDLANSAKALVKDLANVTVTVWDEKKIEKEGLGALRGVSLGSDQPPRLIRMEYAPPGARKTLFFVGKGITFDSGGLSLKTAQGMETMKTDMGGAAAVLSATAACAALGVKTRVVAIAVCTENMPGPKAIKPGDVLRARNGVTMEVLNTDAEGRLVLSDGLSLAAEEKPNAIVDVATLTGAQVVALGNRIAAVLGNNDGLIQKVKDAAAGAGEMVWELPMPSIYRKHIDSEIADIKNIGAPGQAGTIAGAMFLQEFVDGLPWAHLDIAGPARAAEQEGEIVKGGTGFGVRTLVELASTFR